MWIIELENETFGYTFGDPTPAPYLAKTLASKGALLSQYYGIGHDSLDNYIAQVSGQAPNFQTGQDCEIFTEFYQFEGENFDKFTKDGQLSGDGCVYPDYVPTIGNQLTARSGDSWKAYMEDMGNRPNRDGTVETSQGPACGHPPLNQVDLTDTTGPADDSYAARHNPFVYFHSIIDDQAYCDAHVVSLSPLAQDLRSLATTPTTPGSRRTRATTRTTCRSARTARREDRKRSDAFLKHWVPSIMASPAYQANGLIVIVFDESGKDSQAQACCGEVVSLGTHRPVAPEHQRAGAVRAGRRAGGRRVVVALHRARHDHATAPTTTTRSCAAPSSYFDLRYLGDAHQKGVVAFGPDVYTNWP